MQIKLPTFYIPTKSLKTHTIIYKPLIVSCYMNFIVITEIIKNCIPNFNAQNNTMIEQKKTSSSIIYPLYL